MSLLALTSASVGLNVLLMFYIVYTRMRQLKRANELYEEVKKADSKKPDNRSFYECLSDIQVGTGFDGKRLAQIVLQIQAQGGMLIHDMRHLASGGIPIFQWVIDYTGLSFDRMENIFIPIMDLENIIRKYTGPGEVFHLLSKGRLTALDAEAMSIFEDEQIRTGKMDVPPLNGSGEKGRMSDES